jgi:EAL domain-containing protein (putative c-di-GMP-specific phosphodiesterase class I)
MVSEGMSVSPIDSSRRTMPEIICSIRSGSIGRFCIAMRIERDFVKIDGQFVRNVLRDGADECVVESIARMARAFKIHAIAERVESHDVMKRLGELGVSFAQGFFVAVPQPVSELPVRSNVRKLRA